MYCVTNMMWFHKLQEKRGRKGRRQGGREDVPSATTLLNSPLKQNGGALIICNLSFVFHNYYIFNGLDYLPLPTNSAHFCNSEATMPQSKNKRTKKLGYN